VRVAERIATLDLLSGGRVEFGTGESSSEAELGGFGIEPTDKRAMWEEGLRVALRCMTETPFTGHSGEFVMMPPRNVVPKPRQKPHPPLWTACSQLPTIAYAGEKGLGALGFQFVSADAAHAWVHAYYNGMTKRLAKLADYPANPNIALVSMFMCARTDEEARAKADGATFFQFCLRYYNSADRARPAPGEVDMWVEYGKWKAANPEQAERALTGGLIGSPESIRRKLRKFEASHIDQVILLNQAGRNSHQDICDSLELFAEEVMPEFHANVPAHEAWKADVIAGRLELEEIDTQAFQDRFGAKALTV
jgi:alkanesulfonate monooxygenase SsuD/methylene tetrahydromethanopterin reductase-like flavin-dependent oxidoreductase (luciferase family)